jgi:sigma-B regulation protein RsbU (phosphoserine phosphatase)
MPLNAAMVLILSAFLVWDGKSEYDAQIHEKRNDLQAEAALLLPAVARLRRDPENLQAQIDEVCAQAQDISPGHHIVVEVGPAVFHAHSLHQNSTGVLEAMRRAVASPDGLADAESGRVVAAAARRGPTLTVWVADRLDVIEQDLWRQVFRRVVSLLALGAAVTVVVNLLIRHLVGRPLRGLVDSVRRIKAGELGVQAPPPRTQELGFLADEFNAMSTALAAVDRKRRAQMEKARRIQERLLPTPGTAAGLVMACVYEPASEVGGDYFDVLPRDDGTVLLAVADVTGTGVPAAMGAAMLKTLLTTAAQRSPTPDRILADVGKGFAAVSLSEDFASMVVVILDCAAGRLTYANAGHPAAYFLRPGEPVRPLLSTGPLLAIPLEEPWQTVTLDLRPGDRLIMVTDGLLEALGVTGERFGAVRLVALVEEYRGEPLAAMCRRLVDRVRTFQGGQAQEDDMTVLAVEL